MTDSLDGPLVYLAPDRHAFLVLGNGDEPLITWSRSYKFACEQADIHFGTVVAVPIVHDMSWRQPSHEGPATQVQVPVTHLPPAPPADARIPRLRTVAPDVIDPVVPPGLGTVPDRPRTVAGWADIATRAGGGPAVTGYAVGRAARTTISSNAAGWSSTRTDVVGQEHVPVGPAEGAVLGQLVQRVRPFADPGAPELPADREGALRAAFGGNDEAVEAFHAASQADVGTLQAVRDGLV